MLPGGEEYTPPVGFASEPAGERRRWIGRFILLLFVLGLTWMLLNRVINPPTGDENPLPQESVILPGPR